jgi:hypothetical protein
MNQAWSAVEPGLALITVAPRDAESPVGGDLALQTHEEPTISIV